MIGRPKLVLASGSPRRLALLNQAGIEPDSLQPAEVDELPVKGELPRALANRLARTKAEAALASVRISEEVRGAANLDAGTLGAGRGALSVAFRLADCGVVEAGSLLSLSLRGGERVASLKRVYARLRRAMASRVRGCFSDALV